MKTAVEYLVEQLFPKVLSEEQYYHIEQAKEMEKEQKIEFAKLHVEAALKAAVDNVEMYDFNEHGEFGRYIDEKSILNSYPLENIKQQEQ